MDSASFSQPAADASREEAEGKPPPPAWTEQGAGKLLTIKTFDSSRRTWIVNPSLVGQVLLSAGLILGSVMLYAVTLRRVLILSNEWQVCPAFREVSTPLTQASGPLFPDKPAMMQAIDANSGDQQDPVLPGQKIRLKEQVEQLDHARRRSCSVGVFFFANRNATLTVATASAIFSLASLAFVSKRGWDASNNAVINMGVTSGLILFASWTFGQLYGQDLNFTGYRDKYILATSLLNQVASAAANRSVLLAADNDSATRTLDLNNAKNMGLLIQMLDSKLKILNTPEFGGDSSFVRGAINRVTPFLEAEPTLQPPQGQDEGS